MIRKRRPLKKPDPAACALALKQYVRAAKDYTEATKQMALAEDIISAHCRYYGDFVVTDGEFVLKTSYMTITPDQNTRKKIELFKITTITK